MKKSLKKALIVGSVFAAAMNFNACAYGSPAGVYSQPETTQEEAPNTTATDEVVEDAAE